MTSIICTSCILKMHRQIGDYFQNVINFLSVKFRSILLRCQTVSNFKTQKISYSRSSISSPPKNSNSRKFRRNPRPSQQEIARVHVSRSKRISRECLFDGFEDVSRAGFVGDYARNTHAPPLCIPTRVYAIEIAQTGCKVNNNISYDCIRAIQPRGHRLEASLSRMDYETAIARFIISTRGYPRRFVIRRIRKSRAQEGKC